MVLYGVHDASRAPPTHLSDLHHTPLSQGLDLRDTFPIKKKSPLVVNVLCFCPGI